MLSAQGHTVIHSTRHSELELGVDVLSVNQAGEVCAYQLKSAKGERLTLSEWREISSQIDDMVCRQMNHPAIPLGCTHRSFLVVDAMLEESVAKDIEDRNEQWRNRDQSYRKIEVILRGDLLNWARELGTSLWPSELSDSRLLLEIFLTPGEEQLPLEKLNRLIEGTCLIVDGCGKPSRKQTQRAAAATVLLTGIAISSFVEQKNHGAEIEAWTLCLAALLACADRWRLKRTDLDRESRLTEQFIVNSLTRLAEEVRDRDNLLEGEAIYDAPFELLRVRTTYVCALLSVLGIWRKQNSECDSDLEGWLREFVLSRTNDLLLWGEGAVPQFLAVIHFVEQVDASCTSDSILSGLLLALVDSNKTGAANPIPSPYYSLNQAMLHRWSVTGESIDDSFQEGSYCLEGLVHLVARRGWKQFLKLIWYDVSGIDRYEFIPEKLWHFYRWRNSEHGTNVVTASPCPQQWDDLLVVANESEGNALPRLIKQNPAFLLLFLCVMPHRWRSGVVRWLDKEMARPEYRCRAE